MCECAYPEMSLWVNKTTAFSEHASVLKRAKHAHIHVGIPVSEKTVGALCFWGVLTYFFILFLRFPWPNHG